MATFTESIHILKGLPVHNIITRLKSLSEIFPTEDIIINELLKHIADTILLHTEGAYYAEFTVNEELYATTNSISSSKGRYLAEHITKDPRPTGVLERYFYRRRDVYYILLDIYDRDSYIEINFTQIL